MSRSYLTRNLILKCVAGVYLAAFVSIYHQTPGLFGRGGVLPAYAVISADDAAMTNVVGSLPKQQQQQREGPVDWRRVLAALRERPSLLLLRQGLGLDTQHALEALALTGAALALLPLMFELWRTSLVYLLLLIFYSSIVQVGSVFMSYQWDSLLLETGMLCVLLAPLLPWRRSDRGSSSSSYHDCWDTLAVWLVRWLLFRQVFSTGVTKLQSPSDSWWNLSALQAYFESQCLPTALSWYSHHLPVWLLRLSTAFAIYVETFLPFLFFAPLRSLRIVAFYLQVFLQLMVIATGNYGFFNVLIITLCISLLDDDYLLGVRQVVGRCRRLLTTVACLSVSAALLYLAVRLFSLSLDRSTASVTARVAFTRAHFRSYVGSAVPVSIVVAAATFIIAAFDSLFNTVVFAEGGVCRKINSLFHWLLAVAVTSAVFALTLGPYSVLDTETHRQMPPSLRSVHQSGFLSSCRLFGSYELAHQTPGGDGRADLVLLGTDSLKGVWTEIDLPYKSTDVYRAPSLLVPHMPRLDWQMCVTAGSAAAAGGGGGQTGHPWLLALIYRLLSGQPDVLRLVDMSEYGGGKPKYIRVVKKNYRFTQWKEHRGAWWTHGSGEDYLPITSVDNKKLLETLNKHNLIGGVERASSNVRVARLLERVWLSLSVWPAELLILSLLVAVAVVQRTRHVPWLQ